jgi:hypothetical protein
MTTPEDRERSPADWTTVELEALLREQTLLPVPLALVGRILDELLPVEPVRPWALVGRAAAAVIVFCASWLALSGGVPAFADVTAQQHVDSALRAAALPAEFPIGAAAPAVLDVAGTGPTTSALVWLGLGAVLLLGGLAAAWRLHHGAAGKRGVA